MTVQELFKSLDRDDFIKYYCLYELACSSDRYEMTDSSKQIIADLFDKLCNAEPLIDEDCLDGIIFCTPWVGSNSLNSFLVHEHDLLNPQDDGFVEYYGYEFTSMLKILNYKVSDACLLYFCDERQIAASILYEMTFFGWTIEDQEDEAAALSDHLKEQVEEIQDYEENGGECPYVPANEVFDKFDFIISKTETEKMYEQQLSTIEGQCGIDIRDTLYDLERHYISLNRK